MKIFLRASVCSLVACSLAALSSVAFAQQVVLPLWPHATPEPAQTTEAERDVTTDKDAFISGHRTARLTNVTRPTLSVYPPSGKNTGAAALVFPGGGYVRLAWDGEGTDTCDWLNSLGMTCLLVKYRVPEKGRYPDNPADLEDAQQAMRIARAHASEWHIDPGHIGVVGFSAGANLAVLLSTHPDDQHVESTPAAQDADTKVDARANFAIIAYPAYLATEPDHTALEPVYTPNRFTPPTFLIQAENDHNYIKNSLVYYQALTDASVPADMHLYSAGGHGFGIHPSGMPEEHWTILAAIWLRSIGVLPPLTPHHGPNGPSTGVPTSMPCPNPPPASQPPQPGRPDNKTTTGTTTEPNCW
jgi:acetyl esterase/lipase